MRSLILLAFGAVFPALLSAQPANTFFSTFDAERGSVVAPSRDGNLWLGGQKDERVLIVKLAANGKILERHSIGFHGPGLDFEHLTDLFEDNDGKLVGCGNFENDNAGRGFVFRYDPVVRKTMWGQIVSSNLSNLCGITELGPGGDFVLYANPYHIAGNDAELLQLDRNTGHILPGKAKRFGLGTSDNMAQTVYHKGALYACGRFTNDGGFSNPGRMRHALCKIDTATLEPLWSRMSAVPSAGLAQLHGRDLIIDNDAIISTFSGNPADQDLISSTIFLQKNDLNGNLLWARQYDLPEWNGEFAEEVISLPDGYLLYGHDLLSDTSRLFLLKTDKNGFPLSAVKIDFDVNDKFPELPARSKILRIGDALFFTGMSQNNVGQTQGMLAKTDLNGRLGDSCVYFSETPVVLVAMPTPVSEAVVPDVTASPAMRQSATVSLTVPDFAFSKKCGAAGTCPALPDLRLTLDSITCNYGNALLHFTICNVGGQPYDGGLWLLLYDKNPLTDSAANMITAYVGSTDQPFPAGECYAGIPFSSDFFSAAGFRLDTFTKLYALLGANFTAQPPIPLNGFPYTPNQPECGYLNNLDSIAVPKDLCGGCEEPVTFVKKLGRQQQAELAFSMCAASDGNLYVAGRQGDNPMIAKVSPLGEPLWVRNFPPSASGEPIELAEIIEDSDGMIVICGTKGASPSIRRSIVMRYDPVSGTVLWFKDMLANRPEASGIVENGPGGNFILRNNYQQVVGGEIKTRSELWEINRVDGAVMNTLKPRYLGNPHLRLEDMIIYQGKLYAVGARRDDDPDILLPVFAKISLADGQPEWVQLTNPDTGSAGPKMYSHTDIEQDHGIFVVAGSTQKAKGGPVNLYLEKHGPDGSLLWMKEYDIKMAPQGVAVLPAAYVIFGFMAANQWGIVKTDKNGNVLSAKTLTLAGASPSFTYYANRQGQILLNKSFLLMLDHTQADSSGDILLIRTDADLNLDDPCDLLQNIQTNSLTLPAGTIQTTLTTEINAVTITNAQAVFRPDSLEVKDLCPQCDSNDNCPDLTFRVGSIFCSADSALFYKANICNNGNQAVDKPFEVTFYDKNPLTETAQPVWSIAVNEPLAPGECRELGWPLPATAAQYSRLYTLAGVSGNVITPVSTDSFPFQAGFLECNYANNLDSFAVQIPICDDCKNPSTFFRTMGRVDRSELGYSLCAASDGNVYLAGRQGRNPMIAKMTPNGEMIWVRNFPAGTFLETVELAQILEDQEGKIVICGTEGASPNSRKAVAMRYDPDADQVLWFKQYPELHPQALGIFEKTPGGNFVIFSFSDEQFPGSPPLGSFYKARSQVWEIDGVTGDVVPGLSAHFTGNASIYFQDMIPHDGSFYSVGGWSNDGAGRMLLTKLSANDGTPEWFRGTVPDTTQTTQFGLYTNILADSGQLVLLGGGILNLNTPDEIRLVYLSKYTPDGSLLWMKGYEIAMAVQDVVALPDGYAIFGRTEGRSYVMIKTDKAGNLLTVKKISLPVSHVFTVRYFRQNQILRLPNHLLMIDDYRAPGVNDIVLIKTDYDFNLADSCNLLETLTVKTNDQPARVELLSGSHELFAFSSVNAQTAFLSDSISARQWCPQCACLDKPDITCRVDSVYCSVDDGVVANLQICNIGQVSPQAGFNLTFYDKNPLEEAATPLFAAFVPAQPGFGDCAQYKLPLDVALPQQTKIYTLAGLWSDVQTPVSPNDFPFPNGYAECNYANNLDSFEINLPEAQAPKLGPDLSICAGKTAVLDAGSGYTSYKWLNGPATQTYTVGAAGSYVVEVSDACGRALRDTVQVTVLPAPPPTTITIPFYPGDTVLIGGIAYTQADTVVQTLSSASGCDSAVTNILQLIVTAVDVKCPTDLTVSLPLNETEMQVFYNPPQATTNCPNPGILINYIQGPVSGSLFQEGTTTVCFEAINACGIRDTCCFKITVQQSNQPETACDDKTPPGCFRFELLNIGFDSLGQRRYRVRIANTCAGPLLWAAVQIPDGVAAASPKEGATYVAPSGNTYTVRNPNFSPFWSIRYKPLSGSLSNGASEIFEYTLPQQSAPAYIRIAAKLAGNAYSEAHLNTFNCPVLPYAPGQDAAPAVPRNHTNAPKTVELAVRPNPTTGQLFVDVQDWQGQPVWLRVLNAQGILVYENRYIVEGVALNLELSEGLANGFYVLAIQKPDGTYAVARFILER